MTILVAVLVMLGIAALPEPEPLTRAGDLIALTGAGKACLAILAFAIILWVTEAVPFAVTALFVVLLVPIFDIADYAAVVRAGFGNPLITFFIGVLLLSTGFSRSGLGTRMVLHVLRVVGTRTDRVLLGFLVVGALLSMWITDMSVAAVLLPLGVGVLRDARLEPLKSNFGRALMISCAFGPLIGGIGNAGRRRREPGGRRLPARAGRCRDHVCPLDGVRRSGVAVDDPDRLAPAAARLSAGARPPAAGRRGDHGPHRSARASPRASKRGRSPSSAAPSPSG